MLPEKVKNRDLNVTDVVVHFIPGSQRDNHESKGGEMMSNSHDRASRSLAKKFGCRYTPKTSPDIRCKKVNIEVKSSADEIPKALRQLSGRRGPAYIALPKSQHGKAMPRMQGLKTGLINYRGNITKPSTRKR